MRTTDLATIRRDPSRFVWGKVTRVIDLGPYTFVEALDEEGVCSFHVYCDGVDMQISTPSLEGAMLLGIAVKHGAEPMAARWAAKLLNLEKF